MKPRRLASDTSLSITLSAAGIGAGKYRNRLQTGQPERDACRARREGAEPRRIECRAIARHDRNAGVRRGAPGDERHPLARSLGSLDDLARRLADETAKKNSAG